MKKTLIFLCLGLLIVLVMSSCGDENNMMGDMEPEECTDNPRFTADVEMIINSNCAYSGCHVAGTGLPVLTSYDDVKVQIENGRFEDRVLVRQNMPPGNATGPTELSETDLHILSCWIEQGYPE